MNWITVLWPMVAGACIAMGFINLRVAMGDARRGPHIFFFVDCLAVAAISVFELTLLQEHDLVRYDAILRWAVVPVWLMCASTAAFVWSFFGKGPKWLAATAIGLNGAAQIANLVTAVPSVRHAVALHQVETLGGVAFTVPTIVNGRWNLVELVSVIGLLVYIADASFQVWRQGERRRATVVGGGIFLFLLFSRGHAALVEHGIVRTPYLVSFAFLGVIVAMGHELSGEVFRAARLSRELSESERRTELAARAASLGFWRWNFSTDEIWATASAREIFGVPSSQNLTFADFVNLVHPEDRVSVQQAVERSLTAGMDYEAEYRVPLPNQQTRWIAARGRPELGPDRKPVLMRGVVLDITDRRRSEGEVQELRRQLSHAGRLSVMGQLAAGLAHELNQPLGAILRNAEAAELFLNHEPPALGELRDILSDIRKDDERAGAVIESLRSLLKRREVERRQLCLGALVEEVATLARADASVRRIAIATEVPGQLPPVYGDRVQLQQVLLNLLVNAMDALKDAPPDGRHIVVQARQQATGLIEVAVSDQGLGIPSDRLAHVFDPFFTTKPQGMGMGLSISRTIVEAHGGRIWAQNNAEGGAIFRFTLPVANGEHAEPRPATS